MIDLAPTWKENRLLSPGRVWDEITETLGRELPIQETQFFAKDLDGRFIATNENNLHWIGLSSPKEFLRRRDSDFFPEIAQRCSRDDRQIIERDMPVIRLPEIVAPSGSSPQLFLTTKIPLHDRDGSPRGVAGVIQRRELTSSEIQLQRLAIALSHLHRNLDRPVTGPELSEVSNVSLRELYRLFQGILQTSPANLCLQLRLNAARSDVLAREKSLTEIALDYGFSEQSSFTRAYSRHFGQPPAASRG